MAKIDSQVDLVVLRDLVYALFVFHVHGDEFVTDLRGVLGVVH